MARTLTIELPLPPAQCSPNYHGHWRPKADAVKGYRAGAKILASRAAARLDSPLLSPVTISAEFYLCRTNYLSKCLYHPRDEDNAIASLKSCLDGIADAGIVQTDAAKNLRIGGVKLYSRAKEHQGRSCVVLTLTESESETIS